MNERATLVSKLRGYARLASRSVRPNWWVVFTMIGLSVAPVLNAAPGDLDSGGFAGGAGYTATAVNGFDGGARAMARQTDGKLVVAGRCVGSATGVDFCVARYEASGALDSTFGGTGLVLINLSSGQDYATGIAIQSDGKMVVVGHCETSFASDFCLARYLLDGSLDVSFGGGGKVIAPVALDTTFATAVAIQSDGKILVAGQCLNVSDGDFCVVRYLSSGNLDSAGFGTGGVARTPTAVGAFDEAASLALQSDGKIVLAGGCNLPGRQFCVARLLGNGALDTSFGGTGIVSAAFSGTFNDALAVAIQSDGKIIVAGACTSGSTVSVICLARFQSNGAFDTGFGDGGKTELDVSPGQIDLGNAVALQADGKIVVAGRCRNDYFCVIRLLSDGRLDSTYDLDGVGENLPQFSYSEARAALIQPDGKLLVAGQCSEFSQLYFCLARYRIDGRLDKSLQDTGKAITPIGSGNDLMNASVVQPDGKIVSVGNCSWSNFSNFCVSRHLAHGVLDTSFIAAGVRLIAMGTAYRSRASVRWKNRRCGLLHQREHRRRFLSRTVDA